MRRKHSVYRSSFLLNRIEKTIIRAIIACAVLLTLSQLTSLTNPVDFYLKIAGDIDTPAFKYSQYADDTNKISLYFSTRPESPVLVKQNGETLGVIGKGKEIKVKRGAVDLDASDIAYPVTVDIIYNEKKYSIDLHGDIKSFQIEWKENGSL
jgi:hypothetical protein